MGTYNLQRNVKGEGRILLIFSTKGLIYTVIGAVIGLPFYILFNTAGVRTIGVGAIILFGVIGFLIGTFKMPDIPSIKFTKYVGGENIDDIIKRAFMFKKNKKIYVYTKEKEEIK